MEGRKIASVNGDLESKQATQLKPRVRWRITFAVVLQPLFRGFASGEVRFLGASGSYRQGDKQAELTFKFAVSPNAQNIRVGSMTIPFKYGWDYLWVRWADMKYNNVTVKVPIEAYVEQVYQGLNFYSLGIN